MSHLNSIRDIFFEECEDLLEALADGLALLQDGTQDAETLNAVFRAVHSIKGGAGAFKLTDLVGFAHQFETVLDAVRAGRLAPDPDVMHTLLRSADHLVVMVEAARADEIVPADLTEGFSAGLTAWLGTDDIDAMEGQADFTFAAVPLDLADIDPGASTAEAETDGEPARVYRIRFCPEPGLYRNGHEPALLIAALAELGQMDITVDLSGLVAWPTLDPSQPCLGWDIRLSTTETETDLHEVFEFVDGLCRLSIVPDSDMTEAERVPAPISDVDPAAADPDAADPDAVDPDAADPDAADPDAADPDAVDPDAVDPDAVITPPRPPATDDPKAASPADDAGRTRGPSPTLRVKLDRVDRLINAVGEMIINQAMIAQRIHNQVPAADSEVLLHVENYRLLARDLQVAVMAIRAQPVKSLFQRMSRIVREAAEATGKNVRLVTAGDATEVDKTVIERLADPLTHMVRNSVDHGIEAADARVAAGKDPCGTIRLSAAHRSGNVIISIHDDGAGVDRRKTLETAQRRGLVADDAVLSDAEIDSLLFMPGFSTAKTVSNLSGRGVGLDVVRNAVAALGGRAEIASRPGQGTEFTVSLPLTLGVMDGMVVSVAGQTMVVPLTSIVETIRPSPGDLHSVGTDKVLLRIRGRFIPTVDVARQLHFTRPDVSGSAPLLLLIKSKNQSQCALMVDAVHDQRQVVIKGLDRNYGPVAGVSAATILGNGQIALILDPEAIVSNVMKFATAGQQTPDLSKGRVLCGQVRQSQTPR